MTEPLTTTGVLQADGTVAWNGVDGLVAPKGRGPRTVYLTGEARGVLERWVRRRRGHGSDCGGSCGGAYEHDVLEWLVPGQSSQLLDNETPASLER